MKKEQPPITSVEGLVLFWKDWVLKYLTYAKQDQDWLRPDQQREIELCILYVYEFKESQTGAVGLNENWKLPPPASPSLIASLMKIVKDVAAKRNGELALKKSRGRKLTPKEEEEVNFLKAIEPLF